MHTCQFDISALSFLRVHVHAWVCERERSGILNRTVCSITKAHQPTPQDPTIHTLIVTTMTMLGRAVDRLLSTLMRRDTTTSRNDRNNDTTNKQQAQRNDKKTRNKLKDNAPIDDMLPIDQGQEAILVEGHLTYLKRRGKLRRIFRMKPTGSAPPPPPPPLPPRPPRSLPLANRDDQHDDTESFSKHSSKTHNNGYHSDQDRHHAKQQQRSHNTTDKHDGSTITKSFEEVASVKSDEESKDKTIAFNNNDKKNQTNDNDTNNNNNNDDDDDDMDAFFSHEWANTVSSSTGAALSTCGLASPDADGNHLGCNDDMSVSTTTSDEDSLLSSDYSEPPLQTVDALGHVLGLSNQCTDMDQINNIHHDDDDQDDDDDVESAVDSVMNGKKIVDKTSRQTNVRQKDVRSKTTTTQTSDKATKLISPMDEHDASVTTATDTVSVDHATHHGNDNETNCSDHTDDDQDDDDDDDDSGDDGDDEQEQQQRQKQRTTTDGHPVRQSLADLMDDTSRASSWSGAWSPPMSPTMSPTTEYNNGGRVVEPNQSFVSLSPEGASWVRESPIMVKQGLAVPPKSPRNQNKHNKRNNNNNNNDDDDPDNDTDNGSRSVDYCTSPGTFSPASGRNAVQIESTDPSVMILFHSHQSRSTNNDSSPSSLAHNNHNHIKNGTIAAQHTQTPVQARNGLCCLTSSVDGTNDTNKSRKGPPHNVSSETVASLSHSSIPSRGKDDKPITHDNTVSVSPLLRTGAW